MTCGARRGTRASALAKPAGRDAGATGFLLERSQLLLRLLQRGASLADLSCKRKISACRFCSRCGSMMLAPAGARSSRTRSRSASRLRIWPPPRSPPCAGPRHGPATRFAFSHQGGRGLRAGRRGRLLARSSTHLARRRPALARGRALRGLEICVGVALRGLGRCLPAFARRSFSRLAASARLCGAAGLRRALLRAQRQATASPASGGAGLPCDARGPVLELLGVRSAGRETGVLAIGGGRLRQAADRSSTLASPRCIRGEPGLSAAPARKRAMA